MCNLFISIPTDTYVVTEAVRDAWDFDVDKCLVGRCAVLHHFQVMIFAQVDCIDGRTTGARQKSLEHLFLAGHFSRDRGRGWFRCNWHHDRVRIATVDDGIVAI